MKAAVVKEYGLTGVIQIEDYATPTIKDNQVLIKVENSSINYADHATLTGTPFLIRLTSGLFRPKTHVIGMDVAGIVEKVGASVVELKVGDRVFGDISTNGMGGYGTYVAADAEMLAKVPDTVSFQEAAATPLAAVTALQGLRNIGELKAGQKVLINGTSGGVGSFAVQIAKAMGAEVTAICHKDKVEAIKTLNPDHIVDYTKEDVTKLGKKYDLIYDCACYRPAKDYEPILTSKGTYISNGGAMKHLFKVLLLGKLMSKKGGYQYKSYLATSNGKDMKTLSQMLSKGEIKPLIDSVYDLEDLEKAFVHYKSRKVCGKIVINL